MGKVDKSVRINLSRPF